MKNYEKPIAEEVQFETVNIIATSDIFDTLITWGSKIGEGDSSKVDFYGQ